MFEDAKLRGAGLRFANFRGAALEAADLGQADLWGVCFEGAVLTRADLRRATLREADLRGADMTEVKLQNAVLEQADLRGACLRGVDFQGAALDRANLEGAVLTDTRLLGADLARCNVAGIHLGGARLERTRLRQEQLGPALGDELAERYESARLAYLALERNFVELGDAAAASWAYRKKCRMGKLQAREQAGDARRRGEWRAAFGRYARYATDQVIEWLCDYGESISRPLLALLATYVLFTLIYGLTDGVMRVTQTPSGEVAAPTRNPLDWIIFSMSAMSPTAKLPSGLLPRNEWIQLLAGIQMSLGIALAGLVGFVFGNTARR
ncbi:MAG TPA: pentapeptide repeat-containing protein [Gemmataceae bacterium]|nr:pentapeptide repeat-containing protein [Gemmataceae bacterium]